MEATPPLPSKPAENPDPRGLDFDVPDPRTLFPGVPGGGLSLLIYGIHVMAPASLNC